MNDVICADAMNELGKIKDNTIDMVVTSPPYDNLRSYEGYNLDLHQLGLELYRVIKDGGVCSVVLQDQTKNFAKTLTTFRTTLDWCDNIGFKLFECCIYHKYGAEGAWWNKRFRVDHEYILIFVKGERPKYFNKEPLKIPSKHGGKIIAGGATRHTDGHTDKSRPIKINLMKCRGTVWDYLNAGDKDKLKRLHPATFPDKLPYDLIQCFCQPGGIVLDPLCGSGSTLVAAKKLGRSYIGIDISKNYCEIARERCERS